MYALSVHAVYTEVLWSLLEKGEFSPDKYSTLAYTYIFVKSGKLNEITHALKSALRQVRERERLLGELAIKYSRITQICYVTVVISQSMQANRP